MRNKSNKGFTLIELLIVIAIIGILAAVLIPNLLSARTRAQSTAGQSYAREVLLGLESLQSTNSSVSYSEGTTVAQLVTAKAVGGVSLGAPAVAFDAADVQEVLKTPTNGITDAWYNPANDVITVQQTINGNKYCHVLNTSSNTLTSDNSGETDCTP